ncbi:MAG: RnfH family protein [Rhodocyclaceae bacterium]|jgi:putative ubiquitin-RnfH superfamily antitoxin RatB of RatAB toxin-antitoxin module|nr:RnfH family protein [Rhodocyclaceae bacterium]
MRVGVAYADRGQQVWLRIDVPEGTTAHDAIVLSGLLGMYPDIDLEQQKVGVFGKVVKPDTPLQAGDRVEVYRPIICDPTQVPRRDMGDEAD